MKFAVTFETAIKITKYGVSPISCWPLPVGSSPMVTLRYNTCLVIGLLNLQFSIGGSAYNIYVNRHDPARVIKIISEMVAVTSAALKMIICQIEAPRIQVLIAEMETFLKSANREEKKFIQSCVDRWVMTHTFVFMSAILGPLAFIAGPLINSQPLPGDAAYPFSVESTWLFALLYFSQNICIVQVGCMVILDCLFAILLWYVGVRFQILSLEFRKATDANDISECVRQHQELIGYVDQLKITTKIIAVEVTTVAVIAVATGGFVLIGNPSMYEIAKYAFFEIVAGMELLLLTWPADNLIEASNEVADSAFNCDWIGKSPAMLKSLLIVIQRSRNPIQIYVNGLLPVLSLEFYGSTTAASFSYLTTLRAMTAE